MLALPLSSSPYEHGRGHLSLPVWVYSALSVSSLCRYVKVFFLGDQHRFYSVKPPVTLINVSGMTPTRSGLLSIGSRSFFCRLSPCLLQRHPPIAPIHYTKGCSSWPQIFAKVWSFLFSFDKHSVLPSQHINPRQVQFLYVVDYGEVSPDVTWAGSLALGANGAGEEGGSEDWILRRSTNPSTPADVSLPAATYPLAPGGEEIYVNTTGRPQVRCILPSYVRFSCRGCCYGKHSVFRLSKLRYLFPHSNGVLDRRD